MLHCWHTIDSAPKANIKTLLELNFKNPYLTLSLISEFTTYTCNKL
jgi:hypothetical protein